MYNVDASRIVSTSEAQEKRSELLSVVLDSIKQVKEIENGYVLRFAPNQEDYVLISDWLQVENICSPFLRSQMVSESNNGPIWVELSGPSGTKDFLKTELAISRWL